MCSTKSTAVEEYAVGSKDTGIYNKNIECSFSSNKLDKGQFWKGTSKNRIADQTSECSVLPSLEETEPIKTYDTGSLDLSKLKFIVMPKDEEFLDSSAILPIDFWDSDINQAVAIDSSFLKAIDFY